MPCRRGPGAGAVSRKKGNMTLVSKVPAWTTLQPRKVQKRKKKEKEKEMPTEPRMPLYCL